MKKILKVVLVVIFLFIFTACANKKVIKEKDAVIKFQENGFFVNDLTDTVEDSNIVSFLSADNKKVVIEYYSYKTDAIAQKAYEKNTKLFKSNKKGKAKEEKKDSYQKYTQTTEDNYNVVIRFSNTLIYSSVDIEYKKDLNKAISKIGY